MQRKHNKDIVPTAKMLRKNMTKEKNTFGMIFCVLILFAFLVRRFSEGILRIFTVQRQSLS